MSYITDLVLLSCERDHVQQLDHMFINIQPYTNLRTLTFLSFTVINFPKLLLTQ